MEVFLNVESELTVVVTLSWVFLPVLDINEIPLLMFSRLQFPHVDISVFSINTISNVHDLVLFFDVSEIWSLPFEELEPS
jgi:hypothetical protein